MNLDIFGSNLRPVCCLDDDVVEDVESATPAGEPTTTRVASIVTAYLLNCMVRKFKYLLATLPPSLPPPFYVHGCKTFRWLVLATFDDHSGN